MKSLTMTRNNGRARQARFLIDNRLNIVYIKLISTLIKNSITMIRTGAIQGCIAVFMVHGGKIVK